MKVLFLLHVSDRYGAGRSIVALIRGLVASGIKCHCYLPESGPITQDLEAIGVGYTILRLPRWVYDRYSPFLNLARLFASLASTLHIALTTIRWRADLLFTTSSVIPAGALAAFICRKPHIWQIREFVEDDFQMRFDFGGALSRKLICLLSHKVICVSEALILQYKKYASSGKLMVIHNDITLNDGEQCCDIPRLFDRSATIVGRIHPGKGQQDAVMAVSLLKEQGIDIQLNIVGDGDEIHVKTLEQIIRSKELEDRIVLLGYIPAPSKIIRSSDMALVCSLSGALDRVIIESMLCNVPIIVARGGGNKDVVANGTTGLLYSPGNFIELADRMRMVLNDSGLASQMADNALKWVREDFDGSQCSDRVLKVIESLVTSNGK